MTKQPSLFPFLLLLLVPISVISQSLDSERAILLSIKQQWGDLQAMSSWDPTASPCTWTGIQCSAAANAARVVTEIFLYNANISTQIPASICELKNLTVLDLSRNSIPDGFPTVLYNCSSLTDINLSHNTFAGPIPGDIDRLSDSLQYLDLSFNNFTGDVPKSIGRLKELRTLYLTYNSLNGTFPAEIANLSKLEYLQMALNPFSPMALPSDWGKLRNLKYLFMARCNLVGEIPETFGGMESLEHMNFFGNQLVGRIPNGLFLLKDLSHLNLYKNKLSGEIPSSVQSLNLIVINLSQNKLTGSIPQDFGKLKSLRSLILLNNKLTGEIPFSIGLLPELGYLSLYYNNISGTLPPELGLHSQLEYLDIGENMISGPLPQNLCSKGALEYIEAFSTKLSGKIPESLENCSTLRILNLQDNNLTGEIPSGIWTSPNIYKLMLSNNGFTGQLPNQVASNMTRIEINNNKFRGPLPTSMSSWKNLQVLEAVTLYFTLYVIKEMRQRKHSSELTSWRLTPFQILEFTEANIISSLSEHNVIGFGGSGKVYLVQLDTSGYCVAVKKIWNNKAIEDAQFLAEVQILGNIRHSNIVKLLCCISSDNSKLLVYEYLENQSLDRWLFGRRKLQSEGGGFLHVLDWPTRLRIAIGAAQGLCYMHHDCSPPIIHRDIKSSNILLDSKFNAKIADFGLAKMIVKPGELHTMSNVAGSFGYFAPEYQHTKKVNEKVDVYSFGVVLLELTTGKDPRRGDESLNLAQWSCKHYYEEKPIEDALDEEIKQPCNIGEMTSVFKLGIACTSALPSSRPSMKEVCYILTERVNEM